MADRNNSIFDVVTDDKEEANALQTRANLMIAIRDIFNDSGLGKSEFAEKIGLTQSQTSSLLNGHIEKFLDSELEDIYLNCMNAKVSRNDIYN